MKKKEEECTRELALKEQKRKELYAKQGRGSQFTSKEQRDEWIKKELKSLNKQLKDKTEQIDRLTEDLKKDAKRKVELEKRIEEAASEQENFRYILGSVYVSNKNTIQYFFQLKESSSWYHQQRIFEQRYRCFIQLLMNFWIIIRDT